MQGCRGGEKSAGEEHEQSAEEEHEQGDEEQGEKEESGDEARKPIMQRSPIKPSLAEVERHNVTRLPYRD